MNAHVLTRPRAGLEAAPRTFAGLMDLYERNYMMMRCLVPVMPVTGFDGVSRVAGATDLHLRVSERFRFTSEVMLTYRFERDGELVCEPDLRVRVYHDARLAEVMTAHPRHAPAFDLDGYAAGGRVCARWRVNRFLFKWLGYCLRQGHGFRPPPPGG